MLGTIPGVLRVLPRIKALFVEGLWEEVTILWVKLEAVATDFTMEINQQLPPLERDA
jgi:hypothetical protein